MATALSRALGEPVRHVAMDPADYAALGFPGADDLANMFRFKRDFNAEFRAARDVAATRELHPGLMRFEDFLARYAGRAADRPARGRLIPIAPPAGARGAAGGALPAPR
jgi:hypothetical protein